MYTDTFLYMYNIFLLIEQMKTASERLMSRKIVEIQKQTYLVSR